MNPIDLFCEGAPTLFGTFDLSYIPSLLWYAYVPITLASLLFALYLAVKDSWSLRSSLFLAIAVLFALTLLNETLQWATVPVPLNMLEWSLSSLLHTLLCLATFYFAYVFIHEKTPGFGLNLLFFIVLLPVLLALSTPYNIVHFDVLSCEGVNGMIWFYVYALKAVVVVMLAGLGIHTLRSVEENRVQKFFIALSAALLVFTFAAVTSFGDVLGDYTIYLGVSISTAVFLGFVTYAIVSHHAFNVGLIASQALVFILLFLISSQYFFVTSTRNIVLVSLTLVVTAIISLLLLRSVKAEIRQREHIERLAKDLETANSQQIILIHFITHQLKGFMTKSRNVFSMLLEGDFGPISDTVRPIVEEGLRSDTKGVNTIQEILNAANIKSGKVTYTKAPLNFKELVEGIVNDLKPGAEAKQLSFNVVCEGDNFTIQGDRMQLMNAVKNLIDNSIKYTPKGGVEVKLLCGGGKARLEIKDTGVGITPEDMKLLFTEGGHGKESQKVNVESTGFGLYIVKNIIEAHQGKVWAESEGKDKGSRFVVELPVS